VALIHELKEKGIRVGVASSSKNCEAVLRKANLLHLIETRVDGVVSAEIGLNGKPEPDIFTTAADNLNVSYDRSVVVEDAVSGVQAGEKGNFGLTLGIARENNEKELYLNGADIVVTDIAEIGFDGINNWFKSGLIDEGWTLKYKDYDTSKEKSREALLAVGNGYIGIRGAMEETGAGEINYPGSYIAGLYNRLSSRVGDRDIENEDFVNIPNVLPINFKINGEEININEVEINSIERILDFRNGLLKRNLQITDQKGRKTQVESKRFTSMDNPHLIVMQYQFTALNYSGDISFSSHLDGNIINNGVARYRQLNQQHLKAVNTGVKENIQYLLCQTTQSAIEIAGAAKILVRKNKQILNPEFQHAQAEGKVSTEFNVTLKKKECIEIEKHIAIFTSQEWDSKNSLEEAIQSVEDFTSFENELTLSEIKWKKIWDKIDINITGDRLAQKMLRLHMYHLMVSFSPNNKSIDASITARGLHGEAYRGHIFWDELFILPFYNIHFPEVAKSALMYRYRRLTEARKYAADYNFKGAMFPWQSGSDGREETQIVHLNPLTGKWGDDYSSLQRHVSLAIAYNIWQYFHVTNDKEFISQNGAEMFFEICRFWASKSIFDKATGRYSIKNVMGPDEFHEKYPGRKEGGLKDNTYTNLMVVWTFKKAFMIMDALGEDLNSTLEKINLTQNEINEWKIISENIRIVIKDDILSQYDGYFDLKELDWDFYREKYKNIYRMDRLLKAEGESADDFKVAKQADTLQTFYNLDKEDVDEMLDDLGYKLNPDYLSKNLEYYLQRTSHGSTLSRVVHSQLANMIDDRELSWDLYLDALTSDYSDIQGGTTGEGIHAGVMAGTVIIALSSYAGLDLKSNIVKFNPKLPKHWRGMSFGFSFKNDNYNINLNKTDLEIEIKSETRNEIEIEVQCNKQTLNSNKKYKFNLK
jgi:trehalose/maltose hydrolase-like predicted phosphorylase